jgi:hypothetical protein
MKALSILLLTMFTFGCGYGTKATTPATAGVMPNITQLAPTNMNAGGTGFTLTVNGSNFAANSTVKWNGSAQTTQFVSANQITGAIPASAIAAPGTAQITVTNPGTPGGIYGGGTLDETSNSMAFTIN